MDELGINGSRRTNIIVDYALNRDFTVQNKYFKGASHTEEMFIGVSRE